MYSLVKVSARARSWAGMFFGLTWPLSLFSTIQERKGDFATPMASRLSWEEPTVVVMPWAVKVGVCHGAPTYLKGVARSPAA